VALLGGSERVAPADCSRARRTNQVYAVVSTVMVGNITVTGLSVGAPNSTVTVDYCDSYGGCVPFAFNQSLGAGTLTYVNVQPVFQALSVTNESTQEQIRADFSELGPVFRMLNASQAQSASEPSSTAWMYVGYDTTWVRGDAELNGSITSSSDSITISGQVMSVGSLDLSKVTGTIDGTTISASDVFDNITISGLAASGTTTLSFSSPDVQITPSDLGPYGEISLATPTDLVIALGGPSLTFTLTSGQVNAFVNITGGTLMLSQTKVLGIQNATSSPRPMQLVILNPTFTVNGTLTLQDAYIPNYIVSVQSQTVSLIGKSSFKFDDSSAGILALENLSYSGYVIRPASPQQVSQLYWEIQVIPWRAVLGSPYTLLVIIMGLLFILAVAFNTQRFPERQSEPVQDGL